MATGLCCQLGGSLGLGWARPTVLASSSTARVLRVNGPLDDEFLCRLPDLDWSWIKAAVPAYGASGRRDWRQASINELGGDPRELRQKLAICLPRDRFVGEGGVEAWIAGSIALCRAKLAPLFDLTAGEAAFLDGVLDRGEIDANRLDAPPEVQARIAAMPMLAWKCQNVRSHRSKVPRP